MSRLKVKHSNPEGLFDSRVFSQVVAVKVAGLTNPLCLIEIDAIAVVEEREDCME
ncbi:hypothetical protein [Thermoanaerobacterium thermosaccharolyticum]|uniref:hypothetical protein n=1 Tax=Thermoanaerobacterium thermosaccharolyticum TaxID=1517 RepID=UPI003DA96798